MFWFLPHKYNHLCLFFFPKTLNRKDHFLIIPIKIDVHSHLCTAPSFCVHCFTPRVTQLNLGFLVNVLTTSSVVSSFDIAVFSLGFKIGYWHFLCIPSSSVISHIITFFLLYSFLHHIFMLSSQLSSNLCLFISTLLLKIIFSLMPQMLHSLLLMLYLILLFTVSPRSC